jgi:hypothetical protein
MYGRLVHSSRSRSALDTKQSTITPTIHAPGPERCHHYPPRFSIHVRFALLHFLHSVSQQPLTKLDACVQQGAG